jgi:hypothetical protein
MQKLQVNEEKNPSNVSSESPASRAGMASVWRVDEYEINDGQRSIVRAPNPKHFGLLNAFQYQSVRQASQDNLKQIVTDHNIVLKLRQIAAEPCDHGPTPSCPREIAREALKLAEVS